MRSDLSRAAGLRVSKRRVPVRIRLANRREIEGAFYADLTRLDGTRATLADRLGNPIEQYLPLAIKNRHVLVRKSEIVLVDVPPQEIPMPNAPDRCSFDLTIDLSTGEAVSGTTFAILPPAQSRALDYLNRIRAGFVPVFGRDRVVLVSALHIISVTERPRAG